MRHTCFVVRVNPSLDNAAIMEKNVDEKASPVASHNENTEAGATTNKVALNVVENPLKVCTTNGDFFQVLTSAAIFA